MSGDNEGTWSDELDKVAEKITECAQDLREDKYSGDKAAIKTKLEKCYSDFRYILDKL